MAALLSGRSHRPSAPLHRRDRPVTGAVTTWYVPSPVLSYGLSDARSGV
jgi:hypothetical protein